MKQLTVMIGIHHVFNKKIENLIKKKNTLFKKKKKILKILQTNLIISNI